MRWKMRILALKIDNQRKTTGLEINALESMRIANRYMLKQANKNERTKLLRLLGKTEGG